MKPLKKTNIIIIFLIISLLLSILLIKVHMETPFSTLEKNTTNTITSPKELLYQTNINKHDYLIFYINDNNNVSCAIVRKNILSNYILNISGELSPQNINEKTGHFFSSYKNGKNRDWIDWGILYDADVYKVMVNNNEANIVDSSIYNLRLYYFLGDEKDTNIPPEYTVLSD